MEDFMKVNGKIILSLEKDFKNFKMVQFMKELMIKANHLDLADINGQMDKSIKANGLMG